MILYALFLYINIFLAAKHCALCNMVYLLSALSFRLLVVWLFFLYLRCVTQIILKSKKKKTEERITITSATAKAITNNNIYISYIDTPYTQQYKYK